MHGKSTQKLPLRCRTTNPEEVRRAVVAWLAQGKGFPNPALRGCRCGTYGVKYEGAPKNCPHFAAKTNGRCGMSKCKQPQSHSLRLCYSAKKDVFHAVPTTDIVVAGDCIFCASDRINEFKRKLAEQEGPLSPDQKVQKRHRLANEQLDLFVESKANQDARRGGA